MQLGVYRGGVVHRERLVVAVEVILRLHGQGKWPGQGDLRQAVGSFAQQLHVPDLDRCAPADRADDPGHRCGLPVPADGFSRYSEIDTLQCGGKPVRVALAPDLAVGNDVYAGEFHVTDRNLGCVVLRGFEMCVRNTPDLMGTQPRDSSTETFAVDQPFRLGVAPHHRGT